MNAIDYEDVFNKRDLLFKRYGRKYVDPNYNRAYEELYSQLSKSERNRRLSPLLGDIIDEIPGDIVDGVWGQKIHYYHILKDGKRLISEIYLKNNSYVYMDFIKFVNTYQYQMYDLPQAITVSKNVYRFINLDGTEMEHTRGGLIKAITTNNVVEPKIEIPKEKTMNHILQVFNSNQPVMIETNTLLYNQQTGMLILMDINGNPRQIEGNRIVTPSQDMVYVEAGSVKINTTINYKRVVVPANLQPMQQAQMQQPMHHQQQHQQPQMQQAQGYAPPSLNGQQQHPQQQQQHFHQQQQQQQHPQNGVMGVAATYDVNGNKVDPRTGIPIQNVEPRSENMYAESREQQPSQLNPNIQRHNDAIEVDLYPEEFEEDLMKTIQDCGYQHEAEIRKMYTRQACRKYDIPRIIVDKFGRLEDLALSMHSSHEYINSLKHVDKNRERKGLPPLVLNSEKGKTMNSAGNNMGQNNHPDFEEDDVPYLGTAPEVVLETPKPGEFVVKYDKFYNNVKLKYNLITKDLPSKDEKFCVNKMTEVGVVTEHYDELGLELNYDYKEISRTGHYSMSKNHIRWIKKGMKLHFTDNPPLDEMRYLDEDGFDKNEEYSVLRNGLFAFIGEIKVYCATYIEDAVIDTSDFDADNRYFIAVDKQYYKVIKAKQNRGEVMSETELKSIKNIEQNHPEYFDGGVKETVEPEPEPEPEMVIPERVKSFKEYEDEDDEDPYHDPYADDDDNLKYIKDLEDECYGNRLNFEASEKKNKELLLKIEELENSSSDANVEKIKHLEGVNAKLMAGVEEMAQLVGSTKDQMQIVVDDKNKQIMELEVIIKKLNENKQSSDNDVKLDQIINQLNELDKKIVASNKIEDVKEEIVTEKVGEVLEVDVEVKTVDHKNEILDYDTWTDNALYAEDMKAIKHVKEIIDNNENFTPFAKYQLNLLLYSNFLELLEDGAITNGDFIMPFKKPNYTTEDIYVETVNIATTEENKLDADNAGSSAFYELVQTANETQSFITVDKAPEYNVGVTIKEEINLLNERPGFDFDLASINTIDDVNKHLDHINEQGFTESEIYELRQELDDLVIDIMIKNDVGMNHNRDATLTPVELKEKHNLPYIPTTKENSNIKDFFYDDLLYVPDESYLMDELENDPHRLISEMIFNCPPLVMADITMRSFLNTGYTLDNSANNPKMNPINRKLAIAMFCQKAFGKIKIKDGLEIIPRDTTIEDVNSRITFNSNKMRVILTKDLDLVRKEMATLSKHCSQIIHPIIIIVDGSSDLYYALNANGSLKFYKVEAEK